MTGITLKRAERSNSGDYNMVNETFGGAKDARWETKKLGSQTLDYGVDLGKWALHIAEGTAHGLAEVVTLPVTATVTGGKTLTNGIYSAIDHTALGSVKEARNKPWFKGVGKVLSFLPQTWLNLIKRAPESVVHALNSWWNNISAKARRTLDYTTRKKTGAINHISDARKDGTRWWLDTSTKTFMPTVIPAGK